MPFIQTLDFQAWAGADANIQYLQEQNESQDPFRVLAMGGNNDGQDVKPGMYGLELVAGHHPNDLARYRELIGMVGSGIPSNLFDAETRRFEPTSAFRLECAICDLARVPIRWTPRRGSGHGHQPGRISGLRGCV